LTPNVTTPANGSRRLLTTTKLAPPVVWQAIYTNLTGGNWRYTDTNIHQSRSRFYRITTP